MKIKTTLLLALGVFCLVFVSTARADDDEMIDNPTYKHWAQFKPGTYVVTKTNSRINNVDTTTITTTTLEEVTPEKVILKIETIVDLAGNEQGMPTHKLNVPAKMKKDDLTPFDKAAAKPDAKKGKEALEIGGKKVETEWIEAVVEVNKVKSKTRKWTSDEVPGRIVKMETERLTDPPSKVRMIVAKFEVKK